MIVGNVGNVSVKDVERRWVASSDQIARTADAVRERQLSLANTPDELARRRSRLNEHGLDLEAIVNDDDSLLLSFLSRGLNAARAVARVVQMPRRQPAVPVGTGVLVSPRLLLTNNHVMPTREDTAAMRAQLGYEYDDDGNERDVDTCTLDVDRFWFTDPDLDFTLVAVADLNGKPPGDTYGCVQLIEETGKAVRGEALN